MLDRIGADGHLCGSVHEIITGSLRQLQLIIEALCISRFPETGVFLFFTRQCDLVMEYVTDRGKRIAAGRVDRIAAGIKVFHVISCDLCAVTVYDLKKRTVSGHRLIRPDRDHRLDINRDVSVIFNGKTEFPAFSGLESAAVPESCCIAVIFNSDIHSAYGRTKFDPVRPVRGGYCRSREQAERCRRNNQHFSVSLMSHVFLSPFMLMTHSVPGS